MLAALLLAIVPKASTAMKPVVCVPLTAARGKSGAELAQIIEQEGMRFEKGNYELAGLLPGDPPVACWRGRSSSANLPRGAR